MIRAASLGRRAPSWLWAVLLVAPTWPLLSVTPRPGLDTSWQIGLEEAARRGLDFGSELVFTYGPLGFLSNPRDVWRPSALLGLAFVAVVQGALLWTTIALLRPRVGLGVALLVAYVLGTVSKVEAAESLANVAVVWALLGVRGLWPARVERWAPEIGGAAAGFALLVKFSAGVAVAALAVGAVALSPAGDVRRLARLVGSAAGSLLVLWVAAGQRVGDVPAYLTSAADVTAGYTAAMHLELPGVGHEYLAAAVLAVALLALVSTTASGRARVACLVLAAGFLFLRFKHGFVRHDLHSAGFFLACGVLPLGLVPSSRQRVTASPDRGRRRLLGVAALTAGSSLMVVSVLPAVALTDIAAGPSAAARAIGQAREILSTSDSSRREAREVLAVPPAMLARLRSGGGVHVEPVEASAVWAYALPWRPVPVFQAYSAYTAGLDDRNAEALSSPSGPRWILRRLPAQAIDRRVPSFESPAAVLARLCHFAEVLTSPQWQLLERVAPRCGSERPVGAVRVRPGGFASVPSPSGPRQVVYARITLSRTLPARVRELAYKPTDARVELDGVAWRLVTATASQPLVLRVPRGERALPGAPQHTDVRRIGVPSARRAYDVAFFERELRPA